MSIELTLSSSEIRGEALQDLTQDFCNTLVDEAKINAEIKAQPPSIGEKGDPITIGVIALAFITSGAAVALFNTITEYFDRTKTLEFSLTNANGDSLTLKSENVSQEERDQTLQQLQAFLKD